MRMRKRMSGLARKIGEQCSKMDEKSIERFLGLLLAKRRVFIVGSGRSGLVGKAFGMRLMHLGFEVYIVGETITPAVRKSDLILAISGSGATSYVNVVAKTAKRMGATVAAITSHPESELGEAADCIVKVMGRAGGGRRDYAERQIRGDHEPMTPLGTLFELSAMVFLETLVGEIMMRQGKTEEGMRRRHSNI